MKLSFLCSMSWTFQCRKGYTYFKEIHPDKVMNHAYQDVEIKYRVFAVSQVEIHHYRM